MGGIGHLGCFSFHETKNVTAGGEGGLHVINDERFIQRAGIIGEKGTNRAEFFCGMINKYGWVDTGSSFQSSEINSAFMLAQLEHLDETQNRRKVIWNMYYDRLKDLAQKGVIQLPDMPDYATNYAHMFFLYVAILINALSYKPQNCILAVFHYISLHLSEVYKNHSDFISDLPNCDRFADCLLRLPMYYELKYEGVDTIICLISSFFKERQEV